jgi:hypothetical protein
LISQQAAGHALVTEALGHEQHFHMEPVAAHIADDTATRLTGLIGQGDEQVAPGGRAEQGVSLQAFRPARILLRAVSGNASERLSGAIMGASVASQGCGAEGRQGQFS